MTAYDLYHELIVQGFSLSVNKGKLDLAPSSQLTDNLRAQIRTYKADLMALLASNDHTPTANRYAQLITCQQCEHLTLTGYCRVKPQVKPMPEAMHDCASFEAVSGERVAITQTQTYTATELLTRCEEPLFNHLLNCSICHIERGEYCLQGKERGKNYDDVLLPFDDAQAKRESLALRVDKALISGRSVFGARK